MQLAKNTTFSSSDIVRLWCEHLDHREVTEVLLFFWVIAPATLVTDDDVDRVLESIGSIRGGSRILSRFSWVIGRLIRILRRVLISLVIDLIFSTKMSDTVVKCIDSRLKREN